jgi:hypothetical protein
MFGNKKGKSPLHINKQHYWRVPECSCMCEKMENSVMSKKNLLFVSLVLACVIVGYSISVMSRTTARNTATTEKSVGTPVTNVVHVDGIDPVIKDSK